MKKQKTNHIPRAVLLILALMLIIGLTACGKDNEAPQVLTFAKSDMKDIYPENADKNLHITDVSNLETIAQSGLVEIQLDKKTFSVVVKETLKDKIWYSLPVLGKDGNGNYDNSAAAVTLSVVSGSKTIHMNSQDNSVVFGKATFIPEKSDLIEKKTLGVTVNYIFTIDEATAKKTKYEATDIAFSVSVTYKLDAGSLYITCKTKNLSGNTTAKIEHLGLLEFFGASDTAKPGDFILVPDGCGALINTAVEQKDFKPLEFEVYGRDIGSSNSSSAAPALVAAYGMKQGSSGVAVIIEKGDSIATISADRSTGESGFNKVGARFNITPVATQVKGEKVTRYINSSSFEEIKLCLRFVAGSNATYSGIATVCREQLIRDTVLSTKTVEAADYLPFNLTVIGAVKKDLFSFGYLKTMAKLTTFEQAQDMLIRLKSKGVNNIYLRYKGALSGGLNQSDLSEADFMRSLGGASGFSELSDYMATQKMELYLDVNLLASRKKILFNESKAALTLFGKKAFFSSNNELSNYIGDKSFSQRLRPINETDNVVLNTLTRFRNVEFTGFSFNDAGRILYSDYSAIKYNRQDAAKVILKQIKSLATGKKIMADGCNFSAIKNADVLVNMPLGSPSAKSSAYQSVPFIQLIMHGKVDYSGTPINEAKDPEQMMLRYIEYGACPSYEWSYTKLNKDSDTDIFFYEKGIDNDMLDFYTRANEALLDLRGSRMIKHYEVAEGVFCTEYEGNSLIYVNYTDKDYKVNEAGGFSVKAKDFIRIN